VAGPFDFAFLIRPSAWPNRSLRSIHESSGCSNTFRRPDESSATSVAPLLDRNWLGMIGPQPNYPVHRTGGSLSQSVRVMRNRGLIGKRLLRSGLSYEPQRPEI
jgi:hypothetical protein